MMRDNGSLGVARIGAALLTVIAGYAAIPAATASTENDTGAWAEVPPPARAFHSLIYDPIRDRLVMYGGAAGRFQTNGTVWVFPLSTNGPWKTLDVSGSLPPGREGACSIYDPLNDRMVIFGGQTLDAPADSDLSDTWTLNFAPFPTWHKLLLAQSPPKRRAAGAIFDPVRARMVITGGDVSANDTWALDLRTDSSWVEIPTYLGGWPPWTQPAPLVMGQAFYDPTKDRLDIFGGEYVWALPLSGEPSWDYYAWRGPWDAMNSYDGLVLDPVSMTAYSFWGSSAISADLLSADPSSGWFSWFRVPTVNQGPVTYGGLASVHDPVRQRILVVGGDRLDDSGHGALDGVWALSLQAPSVWQRLDSPGGSPLADGRPTLALDTKRHELVGFYYCDPPAGGTQLWAHALDASGPWSLLADSATVASSGVAGHGSLDGMIYDPESDALVLPGPTSIVSFSLATRTFSEVSTSGAAPPDGGNESVYDPVRHRLVCRALNPVTTSVLGGTWALTLTGPPTWSRLDSLAELPPVHAQGLTYDEVGDRLIAYGGDDLNLNPVNSIWWLSLSNPSGWNRIDPTNARPPYWYWNQAICDPQRNRLVSFAASTTGVIWVLPLSGDPVWTQLHPTGEKPSVVGWQRPYYDQGMDRAALYIQDIGGASQSLWTLSWGDVATPTLFSLIEGTSRDGRVSLKWHLDSPRMVTLEKNQGAASWTSIASQYPDGLGTVAFVDDRVLPGRRYGYRLATGTAPNVSFSPEVWVEVPQAMLALEGFQPNPATEGLSVAFTLPGSGPASLELYDVNGRRVAAREVGSLGSGPHVLNFGGSGENPAGVYWLRLSQGGRSLTKRGVVLR